MRRWSANSSAVGVVQLGGVQKARARRRASRWRSRARNTPSLRLASRFAPGARGGGHAVAAAPRSAAAPARRRARPRRQPGRSGRFFWRTNCAGAAAPAGGPESASASVNPARSSSSTKIGALHRRPGAGDAVLLDPSSVSRRPAVSIRCSGMPSIRICSRTRVAGGAGDVGDDGDVVTGQRVHQAGFADIGLADQHHMHALTQQSALASAGQHPSSVA